MQRLYISLCILLCSLAGRAQEQLLTDSTVTVVPNWKKGDKARFLITKVKAQNKNGIRKVTDSMDSYVEISVLENSREQLTMQWKFIPLKTTPLAKDATIRFLQTLTLKYHTTQTGEFMSLLNWKELKDVMYKIVDKMALEKGPKDAKLFAEMKKMFGSRENIETIVMRDVQLYHALYGGEFTLNQSIKAPALLPNVLGGDPLPAILTGELTGIDKIKNTCSFTITQEIDPDKLSEVLNEWGKKLGKSPDFKIPALSISDHVTVILDLLTGWTTEVTNLRTSVIEEFTANEWTRIKKVD